MHWHTFFVEILSWPNGIIVGNLLASVVWGSVISAVMWFLHKLSVKALKAHVDLRHDEIKDHIADKIKDFFDGNDE